VRLHRPRPHSPTFDAGCRSVVASAALPLEGKKHSPDPLWAERLELERVGVTMTVSSISAATP